MKIHDMTSVVDLIENIFIIYTVNALFVILRLQEIPEKKNVAPCGSETFFLYFCHFVFFSVTT